MTVGAVGGRGGGGVPVGNRAPRADAAVFVAFHFNCHYHFDFIALPFHVHRYLEAVDISACLILSSKPDSLVICLYLGLGQNLLVRIVDANNKCGQKDFAQSFYKMKGEKTRRLAAIMFTDIVGYTALMQKDERAAAEVRAHHRQEFQQYHEQYHGEILQYFGDGTLSVFQSGVEAVECAIAIQRALSQGEPVPLRVGLHMGDIVFDGTEVYGDGVNLASRIESMGVAGAILLSGKLNDEVKNQGQISTRSLGYFELKNISQPIEVFSVTNEGIISPLRADLKGKQKKQAKTIAVLPFVNRSAQEDNEYFSDGMTEEIINALAKIKNLKVTSRTSSFFFKNKKIPITQIGKELNVSTILEGSIRLAGNKMRLTAQLIDVADDYHFWSETFDRSIDDIFAVQDEISLLIADKLREHIGHLDIEDSLVEAPPVSVDSYKRYLKSRYHLLKMTQADIEKGLSILSEIIQENPSFPLAYLGMHLGYTLLATLGFMPALEAFAKAQPHLDKAIELDENLPECQLQLSYVCFLQKWDFVETYQHLRKSFAIRPTVEYYQSMASTLVAEAKFEAALNYNATAMQLDPFSPINYHLQGFILYCQEKYETAIGCFEKAVQLKSDFTISTLYWGQALIALGRKEAALTFYQNLDRHEESDLIELGGTTLAYAALGETEKARAGIEQLEAHLESDMLGRAINLLVLCHTMLGDTEAAIRLLEQGVTNRLPMMIYQYVEPGLKPLRKHPHFQKLMRQVIGEETSFEPVKRKYKKALLNKELQQTYRERLDHLMIDKKPYLDPDLTLRSLAVMLDVQANQLSQLLNEGFNQNFSEYINTYRLEAFKIKAADPSQQHLTILALAYDSGFNSKTVFNTFFKKMMGKTPSAYWKEVAKK